MTVVEEAFEALFFSPAGSILGLLLIIVLVTSLTLMRVEMLFVLTPFLVWIIMMYFDRMPAGGDFIWHVIILFFLTIGNWFYAINELSKRRR